MDIIKITNNSKMVGINTDSEDLENLVVFGKSELRQSIDEALKNCDTYRLIELLGTCKRGDRYIIRELCNKLELLQRIEKLLQED